MLLCIREWYICVCICVYVTGREGGGGGRMALNGSIECCCCFKKSIEGKVFSHVQCTVIARAQYQHLSVGMCVRVCLCARARVCVCVRQSRLCLTILASQCNIYATLNNLRVYIYN